MDSSIEQKITSIFQLKFFEGGVHPPKNEAGQPQYVTLIWAAKLHHFNSPLVVSVMHTATGIKGLLFALPEDRKSYTAELSDWVDPVEQALHSIDLTIGGRPTYGGGAYHYELIIAADMLSAQIIALGPRISQDSLDNLGEGIFAAIDEIAKRCNQRGVKRLFKDTQQLNAE